MPRTKWRSKRFLPAAIPFSGIADMVAFALEKHVPSPADSLAAIELADGETREAVLSGYLANLRTA
jgi:1-deoxy-D-xylulose 5-phosphate reductoisomerase